MNTDARPFVILLIEDEKTDAHLVKWALEENRIVVELRHVSDGREALDFLCRAAPRFQEAPRPDLIVLDLNMPGMSGLECLAAIKQNPSLRDIPVVILSTSYAERDMAASLNLGADGYLSKPMDIHQLLETIRILGDRWVTPRMAASTQNDERNV